MSVLVTPLDEMPLPASVEAEVIHQLAPGDTEGTIQRFLGHWRPDFCLTIGFPARPKLLAAAHARGVPLYHASSRRDLSGGTRRFPTYLEGFSICFAPSAAEANLLRSHVRNSDAKVEITGPLTDTVNALPCNEAECDELATLIGGRPVWLAMGVNGLEVGIAEAAHRKAFHSAHRLLMVLVPADPSDGPQIAKRLEKLGWRVALRSEDEEPDGDVQVYIADTKDEGGIWYRLAPATFVGGTLQRNVEPVDPFAPAALGSAVLCGPNHGRNPTRFDVLAAQGASLAVLNAEDLGEAVITLLAPDKAASLAQAGWSVTTESAHVVERLAEVMEELVYEREDQA